MLRAVHTRAELEAKYARAKRWYHALVALALASLLSRLAVSQWTDFETPPDSFLHWLQPWLRLAFWSTVVAIAWARWRLSRLADAARRARTVANISGDPNARVGVLGESDPNGSK